MHPVSPSLAGPDRSGQPSEHPFTGLFPLPRGQRFSWARLHGRELLVLDHPRCQAVFSRQGGQLLHFQPRGERPMLWCAPRWPQVGAIRGGVPVCWPWFGRHPTQNGWPAHGWARLEEWKLLRNEADEQGLYVSWELELCDWRVRLDAELGDTLQLRLQTSHEDSEPCLLSQALHAYWRIGDIAGASLGGLQGRKGLELPTRQDFSQQGELRIGDGCDLLFQPGGPLRMYDGIWQRRLRLDTGGSPETRVWHPGSRPLRDVSWSEALGFLCVEAAGGIHESLCLKPGEVASLGLKASLE